MIREAFHPHKDNAARYLRLLKRGRLGRSWVTVFLEHEYRITGHVAVARERKVRMPTMHYSKIGNVPTDEDHIPPVSILNVRDKTTLACAASKSPMFKILWDDMAELPENSYWLYFADPLPEAMMTSIEARDNEIALGILKEQLECNESAMIMEPHWNSAFDAHKESRFADLLRHAALLLESFPYRPQANAMMGHAYKGLDVNNKALYYYERCIKFYYREWTREANRKKQRPMKIGYYPMAKSRAEDELRFRKHRTTMFMELMAAAESFYGIGEINDENGKTKEAISAYENALSLAPYDDVALQRLARKYLDANRVDDAISILEKWILRFVNSSHKRLAALELLARSYSLAGRHRDCVITLKRAANEFPSSHTTLSKLGMAFGQLARQRLSARSSVLQMDFPFITEWLLNESWRCSQKARKLARQGCTNRAFPGE